MEFITEEHRALSSEFLDGIRAQFDSLKREALNLVDSGQSLELGKSRELRFESVDRFLDYHAYMASVNDLKLTNIFAAQLLCQHLLNESLSPTQVVNECDCLY